MNLNERQNNIIEEFKAINDWESRYKKIIDLGKSLKPLDDSQKIEKNLVQGCQSQVWLIVEKGPDQKLYFKADSDASIVKGLVALVINLYSGATPEEILTTPPDFIKSLGFEKNLSPSRANGLYAMIKQIMYFAQAFKLLQSKS